MDDGFVLGGEVAKTNVDRLMSLGSVNCQSLMIFYQGEVRQLLSKFKGARLDIGVEGNGTRLPALTLLKANGIEPKGEARCIEIDAKDP